MRPTLKALCSTATIMLAVLAVLATPFIVMGPAHAISCDDTITTCLDNLIVNSAARITSETVTTLTVTDLRATTSTTGGKVQRFATGVISSGAATVTITTPGSTSSSFPFASLTTTGAAQSVRTVVPGTGTTVVVTSGNVSTTTTVKLVYWT